MSKIPPPPELPKNSYVLLKKPEYWSAAPRGRSAGRSATPETDPERKSERNSEKSRSATRSARSDFYANQKLILTTNPEKNFLAQARLVFFHASSKI